MAHTKKVALVTGASSGIGRATAARLATAGFQVFGTSRQADPGSGPAGAEMIRLDVTDPTSVRQAIDEILATAGRIDVLVNNAGLALVGALEESSTDQARSIFETNVFGVMAMTQAVLPHMREQRSGRIVNVSSIVGFVPAPFMGLYAATKHALEAYSEALDHEVRTLGIRVSLVQPGFIRTAIDRNMPAPDSPLAAYERARTQQLRIVGEAVAKGADPELVATAILTAATAMSPKLRYPVGRDATMLSRLRRLAPAAIFDRGMRSQFKLDAA